MELSSSVPRTGPEQLLGLSWAVLQPSGNKVSFKELHFCLRGSYFALGPSVFVENNLAVGFTLSSSVTTLYQSSAKLKPPDRKNTGAEGAGSCWPGSKGSGGLSAHGNEGLGGFLLFSLIK